MCMYVHVHVHVHALYDVHVFSFQDCPELHWKKYIVAI